MSDYNYDAAMDQQAEWEEEILMEEYNAQKHNEYLAEMYTSGQWTECLQTVGETHLTQLSPVLFPKTAWETDISDASTTFTASSPNATVLRTSTLGSNDGWGILSKAEDNHAYSGQMDEVLQQLTRKVALPFGTKEEFGQRAESLQQLDPNVDVRRTVALGMHPSGATLTDQRSVGGDDAVNVVEASTSKGASHLEPAKRVPSCYADPEKFDQTEIIEQDSEQQTTTICDETDKDLPSSQKVASQSSEMGEICMNMMKQGADEFKKITGRNMTYSEIRNAYG